MGSTILITEVQMRQQNLPVQKLKQLEHSLEESGI